MKEKENENKENKNTKTKKPDAQYVELARQLMETTRTLSEGIQSIESMLSAEEAKLNALSAHLDNLTSVMRNLYLDGSYKATYFYTSKGPRSFAEISYYYLDPASDEIQHKTHGGIDCMGVLKRKKVVILDEDNSQISFKIGSRKYLLNKVTNTLIEEGKNLNESR